jgi:hypothetical protein
MQKFGHIGSRNEILERTRGRWEDGVKMDLEEEGV